MNFIKVTKCLFLRVNSFAIPIVLHFRCARRFVARHSTAKHTVITVCLFICSAYLDNIKICSFQKGKKLKKSPNFEQFLIDYKL